MMLLFVRSAEENYKKKVVDMETLWDVVIILNVGIQGKSEKTVADYID